MAKKQQRRTNAERSPTARKRAQSTPIAFNFGGKDIEIVFDADPAPPSQSQRPQSTPQGADGQAGASFMNNPG